MVADQPVLSALNFDRIRMDLQCTVIDDITASL
jgi:hypothetical protein